MVSQKQFDDLKRDIQDKFDNINNLMAGIANLPDQMAGLAKEETVNGLVAQLNAVRQSVVDIHQEMNEKFDELEEETRAREEKRDVIQRAIIQRQIRQDVHGRKWALTIYGLPGPEGESEEETAARLADWGTTKLLRPNISPNIMFKACHRLNHAAADAPIYAMFHNLWERNGWLKAASTHLKQEDRISIVPDVPEALRDMRANLLDRRFDIRQQGGRATLRYLKEWPFFALHAEYPDGRKEVLKPEEDVDEICEIYVGVRDRPKREDTRAGQRRAARDARGGGGGGRNNLRGRGGGRGGDRPWRRTRRWWRRGWRCGRCTRRQPVTVIPGGGCELGMLYKHCVLLTIAIVYAPTAQPWTILK